MSREDVQAWLTRKDMTPELLASMPEPEFLKLPAVWEDPALNRAYGERLEATQAARVNGRRGEGMPSAELPGGPGGPPSERAPLPLIDPRQVQEADMEWLIQHYLAAYSFNMVQGHGGVNKGTWDCHVGARATRGELSGRPMMVLYAAAEDEHSTVLKPRLMAARADMDYVRFVDQMSLPVDIDNGRLQATIESVRAELLFIDPLVTYLEEINTWKDQEVKQALTPILNVAAELRCTIVGVHHFTKSTDRGALLSGNGSGAFGNTARVVLAMVKDDEDDDRRILEVVKSNGGPIGIARSFKVELVPVDGLKTPQVALTDERESDKSADEALAGERKKREEKVPRAKLRALILDQLATGAKSREYIDQAGSDDLDLGSDAVWRYGLAPLKDEGRIRCHKVGLTGGWEWSLND